MVFRRVMAVLAVAGLTAACTGAPKPDTFSSPTGGAPAPSGSHSVPPLKAGWHLMKGVPSTPNSMLNDVAAVDAGHAWAVGQENHSVERERESRPVVDQWDGRTWSRVETGIEWNGGLRLVAASSPGDVWAVGGWSDDTGNIHRVVRLRDGKWQDVPYPRGANSDMMLISGLEVVDGRAWMVGYQNSKIVIEEWDGSGWRSHSPAECTTGGLGHGGMLNFCTANAVKAFGPNDVWVAGHGSWGGRLGPALFHWDGAVWDAIPVGSDAEQTTLTAVDGRSAKDMWAAGDNVMQGAGTVAVHGDGKTWTVVPSLPTAVVADIAVDRSGRPWVVQNHNPERRSTFQTWGTKNAWATQIPPAPKGSDGMFLRAVTAVPGTSRMLAVGTAETTGSQLTMEPVILEYVPEGTDGGGSD